jgi:carboxyl-terminal processing protease
MKFKALSRAALTLVGCVLLFLVTTIFAQQLSSAGTNDETTTRLVCDMIERFHISNGEIDDRISEKLLKRYVEDLDPLKLYFLQSDIDQLKQSYEHVLDDQVKAGNVDFAYRTYDLFFSRQKERLDAAEKMIDADHDFTLKEEMVFDPDKIDWAKDEAEANERIRKRVKYELLSLKLEDAKPDGTKAGGQKGEQPQAGENKMKDARERIHRRYDTILRETRQTSNSERLERYLSALSHCFDPHSSYMSKETLEDFRITMELSLEGIGAALQGEDGYTVVKDIVPGGAAEKDKRLKVGDKIIGVGQEHGEIVDVVEMKLSRVVRYIRGEKGTKVKLQVKKGDTGEIELIELTRQKIELKSAEVKGEIIETGDRIAGTSRRIGVISIPSFYRDFRGAQQGADDFKSTARDVRSVLADFQEKGGVDLVVVDLRNDGGGALNEAIDVSGLFIDHGPVVQVKQQNGKIKSHDDDDDEPEEVAYSGPMAVLCNRLSASASEIFAAVIQDYHRGIVIGDISTHGKGTVQNVMPVSRQFFQLLSPQDRGALKLTINQFYRVNGDSTQNRGVNSDVVLPSLLDHMDLGESSLDNALAFDKIAPARYRALNYVTPELLSSLKKTSAARVADDQKFKDVMADIARFEERKNRKTVSLNEEELKAEREAAKREDEVQKKIEEEEPRHDGPIFRKDYYNDEVLRVCIDYLDLLKGVKTAKR